MPRAFIPSSSFVLVALILVVIAPNSTQGEEAASFAALSAEYEATTLPIVQQFCGECHSTAKREGELDLERFKTLDAVRKAPRVWIKAAEMLDHGEMPPEDAKQPSTEQRKQLRDWIVRYLRAEALARAGDPGPVVLRRLNNAEYTYTIGDLTGVQLRPAREFPADSAAGEGFTNAGQALVMSPALVTKYLDAGKEIASHAVFLPDGLRFSPSTTRRDWTDELLAKIRAFYRQRCVPLETQHITLQGLKFDNQEGGSLPLVDYFRVMLAERKALLAETKTPEQVAAEYKLNAKYLTALWRVLQADDDSLVLQPLREQWQAGNDARLLADYVAHWQQALTRFQSVGSMRPWMLSHDPLVPRHDVLARLSPLKKDAEAITLYLAVGEAGDGPQGDIILWKQPRITLPNRPDMSLSEVRAWCQREGAPAGEWGVDPVLFGKHPSGNPVEATDLCVQSPSVIEIRLPAALFTGADFKATATLADGSDGSAQCMVTASPPQKLQSLWSYAPVILQPGSAQEQRFRQAFQDFRTWFPAALCYWRIVPIDEVVTLTLFHREDEPLRRLMLNDAETAELNRLWDELHFVSEDALATVDAFAQILEYASQDGDPKKLEPLRKPIEERASLHRQRLLDAEPAQLTAVLRFAARAYRRPLKPDEEQAFQKLYATLRQQEMPHADALRIMLARIFIAPAFLYRLEQPPPGEKAAPVSDMELASRLSYFLWSSLPDDELRSLAATGRLHEPEVLQAQMQRMLRDARVRRLATEFGCQWLHIYEFDALDEKSPRHFPEFAALRGAMYEEPIRFLTDMFQQDATLLTLVDANHIFANEALARHYGLAWPTSTEKDVWRRIDGVHAHGRGGILGFAATLAKQSGASRTSPVLRGNWVSEVLLGETLPKPPKDVPRLPEDETDTAGLTVRQLVEKHASDARCSVCHRRIDPFGFALEQYDAIGRLRTTDLAQRPLDTRVKLPDGTEIEGIGGLREYLLHQRRSAFVRQFCKKLLGYALGRATQLSDEPLLEEMQNQLAAHDYKISIAVERIILSRQFREIRGQAVANDDI